MSDLAVVVMAVLTAAGAWASVPLPLLPVVVVAVVGVATRRPVVVIIGAALAASALGARAEAGLRPPMVGEWQGTATLVGDPADAFGGLRVDVRIGGKRVEAQARGRAAARLRPRLAGEQVSLAGRLGPVPESARGYLSRRHVGARLVVAEVGGWEPGSGPSRVANGVRRTLLSGAASLPPDRRALYAGFVLGDDRGQPVEITDDFRASGLTHLLVVSGQNVAFVLALLSPLLRRLRLGPRLAAGLVLLLLFGVLTRWEPSVLRAEAMAALALVSSTIGRPVSGLRILALAATGLLMIDPLLVGSLGFLLSVGASAGILLLAQPLSLLLPGPRPLAQALGVTLAAQVGVAPVLVPVFDGLPVASLPANLLAVPVAGPLMMWGMAAGFLAGIAGGWVARLVHVPTEIMVAWVAAVARWGAGLPLGRARLPHLLVLAAAVTCAFAARRRGWRRTVRGLAAATVAVLLAPAVAARWPPALDGRTLVAGAHLWRSGGTTVLVIDGSTTTSGRLLSAMHTLDVRRLDVVVAARPGVAAARWMEPVLRRFPARLLLAPTGHRLSGAVVPPVGSRIVAGPLAVAVDAVAPTLAVRVGPARSPPGPSLVPG
ncbi:MAG TPA: ComEC/Rec2 family competence protein [Acidimicrobiales bacterium]|nr:ComEC/Rec2 family competence protein [Acidimicrobiales bacterium]